MKRILRIHKVYVEDKTVIFVWPWFLFFVEYYFNIENPKACATVPFFMVIKEDALFHNKSLLRHERIHHRQLVETLIIGYLVIWALEKIYFRLWKGYSVMEAYYNSCFEQESYLHQHDTNYLQTRKSFAWFYYMRNKRRLHHDANGALVIT